MILTLIKQVRTMWRRNKHLRQYSGGDGSSHTHIHTHKNKQTSYVGLDFWFEGLAVDILTWIIAAWTDELWWLYSEPTSSTCLIIPLIFLLKMTISPHGLNYYNTIFLLFQHIPANSYSHFASFHQAILFILVTQPCMVISFTNIVGEFPDMSFKTCESQINQ